MNTIENITAAGKIYIELEKDILSLTIKPGELISENQLCERFEVSRTPVRAVLQRLAQEKLVEIAPRKVTRVTLINYSVVDQRIYERLAVEAMVLRDYIRNSGPMDVEIVRDSFISLTNMYNNEFKNNLLTASYFIDKDIKMHEIWFEKMGRKFIWDSMRKSEPSYSRFCFLDMIETKNYEYILLDHEQLLNLIETKDEEHIESVLRNHLYGGVRRLGSMIFNEYRDYFKLK